MIIGLSGYARSGKSTVAKRLVTEHGFTEVAFADALRSLLLDLNPVLDKFDTKSKVTLLEVLRAHGGWEGVKDEPKYAAEVRYQLQFVGSTMRKHFGDGVWTSALMRHLPLRGNIVVSDVRYTGEALAIESIGGTMVRIARPGVGPINSHGSETGLDNYANVIHITNDGTLDDLYARVDDLVRTRA